MERIEVPVSAGTKILAVCAIAMAIAGVFGMGTGYGFFGFLAAAFFGFAAYLFGPALTRSGPALVVDDSGVTDRTPLLGVGLVPWEEIQAVSVGHSSGRTYLMLTVTDPEPYLARAGAVRRFIAKLHRFPPCIPVDLASLDADPAAVAETIGQEAALRSGEGGVAQSTSSAGPEAEAGPPQSEAGGHPAAAPGEPADVDQSPKMDAQTAGDLDALEKLAELRDNGIITEEEFAQKKKQILGI